MNADREQISGVIFAGGQGRRMGGVDKGWVELHGRPLIDWVVQGFAPQVDVLYLSANQNAERYAALGLPVLTDGIAGSAGPLAGLHAALAHAKTPLVATAPCDSPFLPRDLVQRLNAALQTEKADLAVAYTQDQAHPVFCLCRRSLLGHLDDFLRRGERKFERWYADLRLARVNFDAEEAAFRNINTPQDLAAAHLYDPACLQKPDACSPR